MKLDPNSYDRAFVRFMARLVEIDTEAKRRAHNRFQMIFDDCHFGGSRQNTIHAAKERWSNYSIQTLRLFVAWPRGKAGGRMEEMLVIRHNQNGQICFVQASNILTGEFPHLAFFNGIIPRERHLDVYSTTFAGRNVWIYDPKEQFLGSVDADSCA